MKQNTKNKNISIKGILIVTFLVVGLIITISSINKKSTTELRLESCKNLDLKDYMYICDNYFNHSDGKYGIECGFESIVLHDKYNYTCNIDVLYDKNGWDKTDIILYDRPRLCIDEFLEIAYHECNSGFPDKLNDIQKIKTWEK